MWRTIMRKHRDGLGSGEGVINIDNWLNKQKQEQQTAENAAMEAELPSQELSGLGVEPEDSSIIDEELTDKCSS